MRRTAASVLVFSALLSAAPLARGEALDGELTVGEGLEIYLIPKSGFFGRMLVSLGLSSPPKPVSLTEAAVLGRDEVVVGQNEHEEWSLFAKVRPEEGRVVWYDIGKPTTKFWKITLKDGVSIARVKKSASQAFEGSVEGDPWFLQVAAPDKLSVEEEIRPKLVGLKFWLDEYLFQYDEATHSISGSKKKDNYSVLRDAIITALPDELDHYSDDPQPFERVKQLQVAVRRAMPEDLAALRDLLEAKVSRLDEQDPEDETAREAARKIYEELLTKLRERTSDG